MATCFAALVSAPGLRGGGLIPFLAYYTLASAAYLLAVGRLGRDRMPLTLVWGFAVLFRLLMLFTSPALSDDVYRYIWDGRLLGVGANPYAFPVNDPALDAFTIPARAMVNHDWMASPYLPSAQLLFGLVYRLVPGSVLAFQILATTLDLATGWLVMDLLRGLGRPRRGVLIYLWSPLVVVEFAHSAHIDAWMIFLTVLAFWFLIRAGGDAANGKFGRYASALALGAATLTKGVPGLLAPLFLRRWRWCGLGIYLLVVLVPLALFGLGAGWGLDGPLDGGGVFGAQRIYLRQWNYNSGLYHWLEVRLSGVSTEGAVPLAPETETAIISAKTISGLLFALVLAATTVWAWRREDAQDQAQGDDLRDRNLALLRFVPLIWGAFLLLTTTLHPWYVTMILPFLPFLLPREGRAAR